MLPKLSKAVIVRGSAAPTAGVEVSAARTSLEGVALATVTASGEAVEIVPSVTEMFAAALL